MHLHVQDGKQVLTGWSDGKIRVFGPESGKELYSIHDAHHGEVGNWLIILSLSRTWAPEFSRSVGQRVEAAIGPHAATSSATSQPTESKSPAQPATPNHRMLPCQTYSSIRLIIAPF